MNTITDLIQLVSDLEHDLVWELQHGTNHGFQDANIGLRQAQCELLRFCRVTTMPVNSIIIKCDE